MPTPESVSKGLRQSVDALAAARKSIDPKLTDIAKEMGDAVKGQDRGLIDFYLKALRTTLGEITRALDDVATAEGQITYLEKDEAFASAHYDDLEKDAKTVSDAKAHFTKQFQQGKRIENTAEKGSDDASKSDGAGLEWLAKVDLTVRKMVKKLDEYFNEVLDFETRSRAAVTARDAKTLADLQGRTARFIEGSRSSYEVAEKDLVKLKAFVEGGTFSDAVTVDLKDGVKDLEALLPPALRTLEAMETAGKRVKAMEMAEVDVKKAAKTLELDSKGEAKLAKVLNGAPATWEKGLTALAKELKLDTTGKEMLADLKKAGAV